MKKLYNAYVTKDIIDYFEEGLEERKDKIKVIRRFETTSENGELLMAYLLQAEEGVINAKYEFNIEKLGT